MPPAPHATEVALVDLAARYGGAEKRVLQLARGLADRGVPTTVVCLRDGDLAGRLRAERLPLVALPYGKRDPRTALALAAALRGLRPLVVDAHNVQSQLWALPAAWAARTPVRRATVHSEYRRSEGASAARGAGYDRVLRLLDRGGWGFVAVSDTVEEYLAALGVDGRRLRTVWSGVDAPAPGSTRDRDLVRAELGLDDDDFVVACVGRLVPAKDHALLVEAVALALPQVPRLRVLLVGDGPLEAMVRSAVAERGLATAVHLLGHREDVPDLLAASDLCVLTSRTEGLPYALLEAAAAGVPLLATSVGAIPSLFTDGYDAQLVRPGSAADLAAALVRAHAEPEGRRDRAAQARRTVTTRGGTEEMVRTTLSAYGLAEDGRVRTR